MALGHELALGKTRAQRLVAIDATMTVLDTLRRATHDGAYKLRLALERIVVHRENLLIVVLSGDGVGYLVDIHKLVDEDHKALVSCLTEEKGQELEIVVPVVVGDDYRHAQLLTRLGLGGILAAKPFQHPAFKFIVAFGECPVIEGEQPREVETMNELVHLMYDCHDALLNQLGEPRIVEADARRVGSGGLDRTYPPVENHGEGSALRLRLDAKVSYELTIGGKALPLVAMKATLGRQVGIHDHKTTIHDIVADGLEKKRLAAAILSDNETERRATLANNVYIVEQRLYLLAPPYGDERQAYARHHASLE